MPDLISIMTSDTFAKIGAGSETQMLNRRSKTPKRSTLNQMMMMQMMSGMCMTIMIFLASACIQ
jgi:hypothetical protein